MGFIWVSIFFPYPVGLSSQNSGWGILFCEGLLTIMVGPNGVMLTVKFPGYTGSGDAPLVELWTGAGA